MTQTKDRHTADEGVRIRGSHLPRGGQPKDDEPLAQLHIGHWANSPHHIYIAENGDYVSEEIVIGREEIPKVIEALAERAYPAHEDEIRRRLDRTLEDSGDEQ
ncbi:hypothetical protein [Natrinema halophilum]|uniref:hypothetical protein n=1 Tax=Natrinema halophilum TaxID=1699371 RepID=UPI001F1AA786|nr:hypothetical protein [Natrinema halophilum]UHQ96452.1 hypothetical protein HYG82_23720 [Natrinema halophilum]